jgi:general secretion pathway protein D
VGGALLFALLMLVSPTIAQPVAPSPDAAAAAPPVQIITPNMAAHVRRVRQAASNEPADITLNFINADVRDVAKAVLGDYLKLNYEIAPDVKGSVTIQTSQPLTKSQVLPVLEQILKLNGIVILQAHGVYRVVPLSEVGHEIGALAPPRERSEPLGYGIEIVPIHFIAAPDMAKLLEPLAPGQGIVHVDADRNVLIIEGTEEERQTLLDDIAMFDTDWLEQMSFALVSPTYVDANELTRELQQVLGGFNSPAAGLVKLVPINRLNAILAISPQPRYLDQIKAWVARLDRPGQGSDRRVFVYHVQNGRASDLAATLTKVFGGKFSGGASAGASDQPPPPPVDYRAAAAPPASVVVNAAPPEVAPVTATTPSGMTITADETNNALVFLATPQEFHGIETALRELDATPLQVFLEAAIAEVTLTNDLKYGLQYFYKPSDNHQVVLTDTASTAIAAVLPGFSYIFSNGNSIKVILSALADKTHVEVISSPKLLVLNNQSATLQVGDRVPIVTEQAVSTVSPGAPVVNSVQYADTGVILKLTPRVNHGGLVMLDITQEVSEVSPTTTSGIDSPTIHERKINSSVAVQDGETIALGGLISNSTTVEHAGIPFLEEIPVLGNLFRTTTNNGTKTELMVLVTPHVVSDVTTARAVTEELRKKLPSVQYLLDHAP